MLPLNTAIFFIKPGVAEWSQLQRGVIVGHLGGDNYMVTSDGWDEPLCAIHGVEFLTAGELLGY